MATTVESLPVKTFEEIRDDYLRTYRYGLIKRGISNPNVSEGTEPYLRATAISQQIAVGYANISASANAQMPDTADGEDLIRVAAIYGLSLRAAGPSAGPLVLDSTVAAAIAIPTGAQLIDPAGLTYEVAVGGSFSDEDEIQIASVDTGAATNLAAGTVLRWTAPPPFCQPTALVGTGGLTGGVDAETYEGLRSRLLERLQHPPNGSNWPALNLAAESSSTAVQKSFAFPGCNGPSTMHMAVVTAPTATNKERDVNAVVLTTKVIPDVQAAFPEYAELVLTTVTNQPVDVSIGLSLPAAKTASPAGPGGGWLDGVPFPFFASDNFAAVTIVVNSTTFTVKSDTAPVVGYTVCWLSTDDWVFRSAKIVSFTGTGPYNVTIDTPFTSLNGVNIAVNDWVFPGAVNIEAYVTAVLDAFGKMGPGQKTNQAGVLPRALRRPLVTEGAWPSDLNAAFLRNLTDVGEEVYGSAYLYRSSTSPTLPAAITDPPSILVPRQIGLYPSE